jgi:hypothetical protein
MSPGAVGTGGQFLVRKRRGEFVPGQLRVTLAVTIPLEHSPAAVPVAVAVSLYGGHESAGTM